MELLIRPLNDDDFKNLVEQIPFQYPGKKYPRPESISIDAFEGNLYMKIQKNGAFILLFDYDIKRLENSYKIISFEEWKLLRDMGIK